jgi:hypothetical protein
MCWACQEEALYQAYLAYKEKQEAESAAKGPAGDASARAGDPRETEQPQPVRPLARQ